MTTCEKLTSRWMLGGLDRRRFKRWQRAGCMHDLSICGTFGNQAERNRARATGSRVISHPPNMQTFIVQSRFRGAVA
jgi:hypothetical protein